MLTRNRQMALKIEAVEGTPETLLAADADLLVYEPKFKPIVPYFERTPARGTMSKMAGVSGIRSGEISGRVEARGSGSIATAPTFGLILRIGGFVETAVSTIAIGAITGGPFVHNEIITGGTSSATARVIGDWPTGSAALYIVPISGTLQTGEVLTGGTSSATATSSGAPVASQGYVYDVTSTEANIKSGTVAIADDGIIKQLYGARAKITYEGKAGEPGFFGFTITGVLSDWADQALFSSVAYETTVPPKLLSAAFKIGAYANAVLSMVSFDMQNEVSPRTDINKDTGMHSFRITDRNPQGSIDPEQTLIATYNWFSYLKGGATQKVQWKMDGGSPGNRLLFIMPEAQVRALEDQDTNGIVNYGLNFQAASDLIIDRDVSILAY